MKKVINYIALLLLSLLFCSVKGQSVHDVATTSENSGVEVDHVTITDSTKRKSRLFQTLIDGRIDSLSIIGERTDKLQHAADSLDEITGIIIINRTIDSLQKLRLSPEKYQNKLDSLSRQLKNKQAYLKVDSISGQLKKKIQHISHAPDSLQAKVNEKEIELQQAIHKKISFTDSLTLSLKDPVADKEMSYSAKTPNVPAILNKDAAGLSTKDLEVSKVEMPDQLKKMNEETARLSQLPKEKIRNLGKGTGFGDVKDEMQKVTSASGKMESYNKDLKNITSGNTEKVEALPKDIENAVMNQTQLKDLSKEVKQAEAAKNVLKQYQDAAAKMNEEGGKQAIKDIATRELPDLFSGQEEKLQAGIAKLEKLKRKYGSIPDSRYLPKHAPSDMNGKPIIERILPGINFQFFQLSGLTITDFSPFTMYRFTGRLRSGIGASYRLQLNSKVQPVHLHDAYGYRIMTDYKVFSGFHLHAEGEWMKITPYDPITNVKFNDSEKKQWIPGLYLGILKQYKAGRHINGNFHVMYNFLYQRNGLYPNRINIRFGFEFPLKKKSKF